MSDDSSNTGSPQVPWQPVIGVLFLVVVYYFAQILSSLLVSTYPALRHWSAAQASQWLSNSVAGQFAFVLIAEALSIYAVYRFLRFYKQGFAAIGLKHPRRSDPVYGLLAVPVYFTLYLIGIGVVSHFFPSFNVNQQQEIGFTNVHGILPLVLTFLSLVVLPPLAEEIMVRGFLYSTLKKALPTFGAVLLTSLLFASAHLPEGGAAGPLYVAALDTFVLSLVLIYLREKTGNLWASITLHAMKNGIAFVALFVIHAR